MSRVVGFYKTEHEAIQAIENLQQQGYNNKKISVLSKDNQETETIAKNTKTCAGREGATDGLARTLNRLGVPENKVGMYETHFNEGEILVLVEEDENTIPNRSGQDMFTTKQDLLIENDTDTTIRADKRRIDNDPLNASGRGQAGL